MRIVRTLAIIAASVAAAPFALAQEQDDVSKAMDSTATQWSYQFAYQMMPDYHGGTVEGGAPRPAGADDYVQLRIVAPLVYDTFTVLPRLTLRHYENAQGQSGLGNTELFGLIIPKSWDWGSGRMGIGPLITLPGNENVARYGLLLTQSWRSIDPAAPPPPGTTDTNPLGIAPFLNYQLGDGWYVGNGDMVAQWDWSSNSFYMPIGVRIGKVFVKPKGSWNYYFEYQTSLIYDDWPGAAVKNSYRFNVTYTVPVGR
jgi:hypothetical protein